MNTTNDLNAVTASPPQPILANEHFRLEYSIRASTDGKALFEFSSQYEVPFGMQREFLNATAIANAKMFEHAVQLPTSMALRKVIEEFCERDRQQAPLAHSTGQSQGEPLFSGDFSDVSPKDGRQEPLGELPPQLEPALPRRPVFFDQDPVPPAVPKESTLNPAGTCGRKTFKQAA
jgi:hypothetical protein